MGSPTVSVAIGAYNVEAFIGIALRSVLAQDFDDLEIVVVDDGSTDRTVAAIEAIGDPRIHLVRAQHRGSAPTRNEAIRRSRGRYIALMDSDDVWLPGKLRLHVEALNANPHFDLSFGLYQEITADGVSIPDTVRPPVHGLEFEGIFIDCSINGSAALVRREALAAAGGFDEAQPSCLDLDLWLRIALLRTGNIHCVPRVLNYYRKRDGQITGQWQRMLQGWERMVGKFRAIAPERVQHAYAPAAGRWLFWMALIANKQREHLPALQLLGRALRSDWRFVAGHPYFLRFTAKAALGAVNPLAPRRDPVAHSA